MGPDMSHGHGLGYRLVATDHCNMQNRRGTSYAASVVGSIGSDEPFLAFVDLGRNWSHAHQLTHRGSLAKCKPSVMFGVDGSWFCAHHPAHAELRRSSCPRRTMREARARML